MCLFLGPRGLLWPTLLKCYSAVKSSNFEIMDKITQTYGPVLGFFFGPFFQPIVVVSSSKSVIEALNNPSLQDRPITLFGRARTAGFGLGNTILFMYRHPQKDLLRPPDIDSTFS